MLEEPAAGSVQGEGEGFGPMLRSSWSGAIDLNLSRSELRGGMSFTTEGAVCTPRGLPCGGSDPNWIADGGGMLFRADIVESRACVLRMPVSGWGGEGEAVG